MLSKKQISYHKSLVKKAHINKKNRFNNDEERRDYLKSRYGLTSTKDMSIAMLIEFNAFLSSDFIVAKKQKQNMDKYATTSQIETIKGLWWTYSREKTHKALIEFIFKICKVKPLYIKNLHIKQAQKIILALNNMKKTKGNQ